MAQPVHIDLVSPAPSDPPTPSRSSGQQWRADLVLVAGVLFVVLTTVAMAIFPGGATFDLVARHYHFFGNYLSDLGATHTYSGKPNAASRILFTTALAAVGVSFALFGPAWRVWSSRGRGAALGALGSVSAVLGGGCFVGAALTPWDRDYDTHTTLVRVGFGLLFAFIACLALIQIRNAARWPWIAANVGYLVALAAYVLVVFDGPSIYTPDGLEAQVTAQKAIVYATVLNLAAQAWAVRTLVRRSAGVRSSSRSDS